jgi:hypothetical protein
MNQTHRWTFHRLGGLDQVALDSGDDLAHLEGLDQKLWVALSCPTRGLEIDARTLQLLDLDKDGRVRAPEILAALDWCKPRLRSLGELIPSRDLLDLSSIDDSKPEGRALLGAARRILSKAGKEASVSLTSADVADTSQVYAGSKFNGDGVVTADSAADPAVRAALLEAVDTLGGVADRSGTLGINRPKLEQFFLELAAYAEWARKGQDPQLLPFAEGTAARHAAVTDLETKAADYFQRCRLAAYDPRGATLLNATDAELVSLASKDLAAAPEVAALPLARIEPGRPLPLLEGVNPAWTARTAALARLTGKSELRESEWLELREKLSRYAEYLKAKQGALVEKLGLARAEVLLASGAKEAIEKLIVQDELFTDEANAVEDVVRLVHYRRDLHRLLRNFINFADFYDPKSSAIFQAGTLYLDSRSCELCVRVDDPGAHATLASLSRMYIAYCDCKRPSGESMKIAACFTQGDSDYLMVGRNGIFYDRSGRDWDANIIKVIENPISIRQAFFAPYKKFMRLVEEQALRFAASKEKEADAKLAGSIDGKPVIAAPPAVDTGKMVGIVAALGVGIGALGTVFGALVSGFFNLQPWWAKLVAIGGVLLLISGPSMLLAFLKLRARTLGPMLDANGWAVNGRVKVNIPLGTSLTGIKVLPQGSRWTHDDPFEDVRARRRRQIITALLVAIGGAVAGWWLYYRGR